MSFTKILNSFSFVFNEYIKKYLVSFVLKSIGMTGGLATTVVSFVLTKVFFYVKKEAELEAQVLDQKKEDKILLDKYKSDIESKVPESELIKDESDILNGGKKL